MRENMELYRGKREFNGDWVEGNLIVWPDGTTWIMVYNPTEDWLDRFAVDPATVGEYTGLTDKNGKQIFESDIVTGLFLYALPVDGVCTFRDGAFGLEWQRGGAKEFSAFTSMCNVQYEVIGNIHDNKEKEARQ